MVRKKSPLATSLRRKHRDAPTACPVCWASLAISITTALSALTIVFAASYVLRHFEVGFCDGTCFYVLPRSPSQEQVMPWPLDFPGCQSLETSTGPPARIIHQTWKTADNVPKKFQTLSRSWRRLHPEWKYVLWTDKTNRDLVVQRFPYLLPFYDSLPKEILRVDVVRFLYLYAFGGVYADLDVEALKAVDENVHGAEITFGYIGDNTSAVSESGNSSSTTSRHAIPNALMASRHPGHPFWLAAVAEAIRRSGYIIQITEALAGPIMLTDIINAWKVSCTPGAIKVHPPGVFFPYDWSGTREFEDVCSMGKATFNAEKCKNAFPNATTITYWAHSWKGTNKNLN